MGLESATFVGGLVPANPIGSDQVGQGDDHIRLIKNVLQGTFPNATRALYFPTVEATATDEAPIASDDQKFYVVDATAGLRTVTLPTLSAGLAGWSIDVQKDDASTNAVRLLGTINGENSIDLTQRYAHALVVWTGTTWRAFISGQFAAAHVPTGGITAVMLATEVVNRLWPAGGYMPYAGLTAPAGWLFPFGQNVVRATYPALFTALGTLYGVGDGSTTFGLPDLRGRVLAGRDNLGGTASGRLQVTTTITTTASSATATVASATGIALGMYVISANVPAGVTVVARNGLTITLSSGTGVGAGTAVAARFSLIQDPELLGPLRTGGAPTVALAEIELAAHRHLMFVNSTVASADNLLSTNSPVNETTGGEEEYRMTSAAGEPTIGRTAEEGSGAVHQNLQPTFMVDYLLKAH